MENIKDQFKFWLASMKTLTNCENRSINPLQIACCGIQEAACDSVNCSVSLRWFWSVLLYFFSKYQADYWLQTIDCWLFQRMNWVAASLVRGRELCLMRLPVKSPELVSVFIAASKTLKSIFLNSKDAKKLKKHWRLYRKKVTHFPCAEQAEGQRSRVQCAPPQPASHLQVPSTQVPCTRHLIQRLACKRRHMLVKVLLADLIFMS